jgi:hypothetical protein
MGAFFWSSRDVYIKRRKHDFYHFLAYADFYINRLHRDKFSIFKIGSFISLIRRTLLRFIDIGQDDISDFENEILGGILGDQVKNRFYFRQKWAAEFASRFSRIDQFRVIKSQRGEARPHKLVILCKHKDVAKSIIHFLRQMGVFSLNGYLPLVDNLEDLPNLKKINGCVIEIPIEDDEYKMNYLFDALDCYICQ